MLVAPARNRCPDFIDCSHDAERECQLENALESDLMQRTQNQPLRKRSGSAIVETAFMLPILLGVTFGVVEFGRALMVSNLITNAAREGARLGIVKDTTTAEVKAAVVDQVQRTVGTTIPTSSVIVTVTPYSNNPDPNNETANAMTRDLVDIEVKVPYNDVGYFFRYLANIDLKGQAAMRHE